MHLTSDFQNKGTKCDLHDCALCKRWQSYPFQSLSQAHSCPPVPISRGWTPVLHLVLVVIQDYDAFSKLLAASQQRWSFDDVCDTFL